MGGSEEIKPVSCRVASYLDNKTDRIIYEEAVCMINKANTRRPDERPDIGELEESVKKLEEAVKDSSPGRFVVEAEVKQVNEVMESLRRKYGL